NSMETAINNLIKHLPKGAVKTITVDRGTEFTCYQNIDNQFHINVYFAVPYSAWQRGTNENTNGLLREYFPKKTDLANVNQEQLNYALDSINYRPRQGLTGKVPYDVLCD
ncbi:IS30 family transposase, partial [Staphylococcus aureus]|uniref:IS30 family transposase n=1 Tax=Staphylococcus aureus TaxID=1280 RepID=UPI003BA3937A